MDRLSLVFYKEHYDEHVWGFDLSAVLKASLHTNNKAMHNICIDFICGENNDSVVSFPLE